MPPTDIRDTRLDSTVISESSRHCREGCKYTSYTNLRDDTTVAPLCCPDAIAPVSRQTVAENEPLRENNQNGRLAGRRDSGALVRSGGPEHVSSVVDRVMAGILTGRPAPRG